METNELLKRVRKIEIKSKGLSNQIFSGGFHSAFKGRGMSFAEVREYQWGDDVRNIDWNVTARYDTPFIKVFEEEREMPVMLLLDISPSTFFGTQLSHNKLPQQKNEILAEICALLAFSALNNNDKVGVIFFTDKIEKIIPPDKGRNHVLRIIREVIDIQAKGKGTDIDLALKTLQNVTKSRSVVFVMSDYFNTGKSYKESLGIAKKKNDIVGIHLFDDREKDLPENLLFLAEDAETGQVQWIDTSDIAFTKQYKQRFEDNLRFHKEVYKSIGADFLSINTKDSYVTALMNLFKMRERKV